MESGEEPETFKAKAHTIFEKPLDKHWFLNQAGHYDMMEQHLRHAIRSPSSQPALPFTVLTEKDIQEL